MSLFRKKTISVLLYGDDIVLITQNAEDLQKIINALREWTIKCGLSLYSGSGVFFFFFFVNENETETKQNENETETKQKRSINGFFETRFEFFRNVLTFSQ